MQFFTRQFRHIKKGGSEELLRKIKLFLNIITKKFRIILTFLYRFCSFPLLKFYQLVTPVIYIEDLTKYLRQASPSKHLVTGKQKITKKPICIYTRVWGSFSNLYDSILMRSLFQQGNILELLKDGYQVKLSVHILESEMLIINNIINKYLNTLSDQQLKLLSFELVKYSNKIDIIENSLSNNIKKCIANESICIMATPDMFFGNNSISNIVKINMGRELCIAAVHFRVNDNEFKELLGATSQEISNPCLVSMSMRSPHQTLRDSFIEKENCSFATGLTIQRISDHSFATTFRAPSIFLANFTQGDLKYFLNHPFNHWDHEWPTQLMVEGRYKCIGSSDAFFSVELTEPESHLCIHNSEIGNDEHMHHTSLHKELHRNFVVIVTSANSIETNSKN